MREHKLTDEQWAAVQPHIPIPEGETEANVRRLLDGIIYAANPNHKWDRVNQEFGPYELYKQRFDQWSADGTWTSILKSLETVVDEQKWSALITTLIHGLRPSEESGFAAIQSMVLDMMFPKEETPPPEPISDEQWEAIAHLFQETSQDENPREIVDGIIYGQYLGYQWNTLPEKFEAPLKYEIRYDQWNTNGLWQHIESNLAQQMGSVNFFEWSKRHLLNHRNMMPDMNDEEIEQTKQQIRDTLPYLSSANLTWDKEGFRKKCDVPTKHSTIQAAIDAAESGATIRIFPGQYEENLIIRKSISIHAGGSKLIAASESHAIHCKDAGLVSIGFKSIEQNQSAGSSDEEQECGLRVEGNTELYIKRTKFLDWTVSLTVADGSKAFINSCKFYSEKGYRDGPTVNGVSVINAFAEVYDCDFHFNSGAEFLSALSGHNSEVGIHNSSFFLLGNPGGVVDLITLIDCKAEVHDNYLMAPETECLRIDGSQNVKISNNTIISKILAIEVRKLSSKLESKEILLEQNRIFGTGMSAGIGIWDNHVTVRGNTVMGYESGILIVTGSVLVEDNLVVGNNKCGLAFSEFASQLIFNNNKIVGNSDVGIGVWEYQYLHPEQDQPKLETIEGKHNIVSGNLQEDLRLKDISIPPDFLTQE